jgi:hypothetical protein
MRENEHPDLFAEAAATEFREAAEALSFAMTMLRMYLRHQDQVRQRRAIADERDKRAQAERDKAERDATRARWQPANDRQWLRTAGPAEVASAWCAAAPYADPRSDLYERGAELAVNNCEGWLRQYHPYAMNYYDRLRADELGRIDAMGETMPLFLNHPSARPQEARPRLSITARGVRDGVDETLGPQREEFEQHFAERQTARGSRIVERMQYRAMTAGRPPLSPDEQRTVLDKATNLSPELIGTVIPATAAPRPARRPWENDSPFSVEEVVAYAVRNPDALSESAPAQTAARQERRARHA